jgi:hypothetical protein
MLLDQGIDIEVYNPKLHKSMCNINVMHIYYKTKRDQLFASFAIGERGSIRQAPNSITWAFSLKGLGRHGDKDAGVVIKCWNASQPRSSQITGAKAQAVKNILELDDEAAASLLKSVARFGWQSCPWSDESIADKRNFPGSKPRLSSKKWIQRLTVSNRSFALHCLSMDFVQEKLHPQLRRKLVKTAMHEQAQYAAFALTCVTEMQDVKSIPDAVIDKVWLTPFREGDPMIVLAVTCAVAEKSEKFNVVQLPIFDELANGMHQSTGQSTQLEFKKNTSEVHTSQANCDTDESHAGRFGIFMGQRLCRKPPRTSEHKC